MAYFWFFIFSMVLGSAEPQKFKIETLNVFDGVLWGLDFIDKDNVILGSRNGQMWIYNIGLNAARKLKTVPQVYSRGQGGLLDIRTAPWDKNQIFFTFSQEEKSGMSQTALASARIQGDELKSVKIILKSLSESKKTYHYGSRIEFDKDKNLFVTIGDRGERQEAQNRATHNGKVLRLKPKSSGDYAAAEIFTLGHRNPQGLTMHPKSQTLWLSEHGPRGGDEINILSEDKNYGWPEVTFGREYYGPPIGVTEKSGMIQPLVYWVPSISPAGMLFYTGDRFKSWHMNLFVATLSGQHLRRLEIQNDRVIKQDVLLENLNERFRTVRQGPDGFIYLSTDSGKLLRLSN